MAGQRSRLLRSVMINGEPLMKEVDDFTPPNPKKEMADTRGGSFITSQIMTGLEKMSTKIKIIGATQAMLSGYGLLPEEKCQIDVKDSLQDADGEKFAVHYSITGEIISIDEGGTKMGDKPEFDIEIAPHAYKKTENGKVLYDIDVNIPSCDLGQGDLLAEHRRNVGRA